MPYRLQGADSSKSEIAETTASFVVGDSQGEHMQSYVDAHLWEVAKEIREDAIQPARCQLVLKLWLHLWCEIKAFSS